MAQPRGDLADTVRIREHRDAKVAPIENGLTNALVELFNTKIRLITRRVFEIHNVNALIARLASHLAVSVRNYPLERQESRRILQVLKE